MHFPNNVHTHFSGNTAQSKMCNRFFGVCNLTVLRLNSHSCNGGCCERGHGLVFVVVLFSLFGGEEFGGGKRLVDLALVEYFEGFVGDTDEVKMLELRIAIYI